MIRRSFLGCLAFVLAVVTITGCDGSKLASVKGTVTYKGEPLKSGEITFIPVGGRPAYGKIRDGQIVEVKSDSVDGAPIGNCKVTIVSQEGGGNMYAKVKSLIPDRYGNPDKSNLTADIKPGGSELKFELTP